MRAAAVAVAFSLLIFFSCGYRGPIAPPSPELPNAVTDLAVVERGDHLVITFTTPPRTTDSLAIKRFSEIDLRVGAAVNPFDFDRWAATAKQYQLNPPPPNDPDDPRPRPMDDSIPISDWLGQRVAVAVRTAIKKSGHYSQWSNVARMEIVPPLQPPAVKWEATREGYKLTWTEEHPGMHYEVFRQGPNEKTPAQIGTAEKPEYVDTTSQWDTPYIYTVVAQQGSSESLASEPVRAIHADTFAPSVPASITALATPESIEVSWQRSPESDLKGYYVYRSVNGGPFIRQGDLINLPTYSDHNVEHGKTYQYAISAVDQKGNESEKSAPAAQAVF